MEMTHWCQQPGRQGKTQQTRLQAQIDVSNSGLRLKKRHLEEKHFGFLSSAATLNQRFIVTATAKNDLNRDIFISKMV